METHRLIIEKGDLEHHSKHYKGNTSIHANIRMKENMMQPSFGGESDGNGRRVGGS